jgi:hypothetical protein
MNVKPTSTVRRRLALLGAVLAAFVVGSFFALGLRSLVVPTASADPAAPNPGHAWNELEYHGTSSSDLWLGTTSDEALELHVDNDRALRLEPDATSANDSPNIIGGYSGNSVTSGATGAVIGGGGVTGMPNRVTDDLGVVGGGQENLAGNDSEPHNDASHATVGGGYQNTASGLYSTVGGGSNNIASGHTAAIGGGYDNEASYDYTTVGGGRANTASGDYATVGGGNTNTADATYGAVGGGYGNAASGNGSTIGGGIVNQVTDNYGTVGGGSENQAGNGDGDMTNANNATVGGGWLNIASDIYATIAGGEQNTASGQLSTVGGGGENTASGALAVVPGGKYNSATGVSSFAGGYRAQANHDGAFVWAGHNGAFSFASTAANQFSARATGGVRFVSAIDGSGNPTAGVSLASGGSSWSSISDRNLKANFELADGQDILTRLASVSIETWNLQSQDPSIRHIGPMAQDFYAAFGVGEDDTHITTMDADGVALAAIQGLYELSQEQAARIEALEARVSALEGGTDTGAPIAEASSSGLTVTWVALCGGLALALVGLALVRRRLAGGGR